MAVATKTPIRLYAITSGRGEPGDALVEWASGLFPAGVDGLQLREKHLSGRALSELATSLRGGYSGTLVVNGRADVALASGADGAHLPVHGVPLRALRRRFGDRLLLGCSTHSPEEVRAARDDGADYVVFGPVYDTASKRPFGAPVGLEALRRAVDFGVPVLALGGIEADRLPRVAACGAAGVAGIRVFQDPNALTELVQAARECWATEDRHGSRAPASREGVESLSP